MNYRDFGKSGFKVSEIGFGAWAIGGNSHGISYGPTDDKESQKAIEKSVELGCNYFDTADVYGWGHSEELLGSALKPFRDRIIISTKVGSDFYQGYGFQTFSDDYIQFALKKSLSRLKTDYIDVYLLHNPPLELIKTVESFELLKKLKQEGKVRAWGLSVTTVEEAKQALHIAKPDCMQIPLNLFSKDEKLVEEILPIAYKQGCALVAREPLANGFLSGKYHANARFLSGDMRHNWPRDYVNARVKAAEQLKFLVKEPERSLAQAALLWVLKFEKLSLTIVGCKTEAQVLENFGTVQCPGLEDDELEKVENLQENKFGL